MLKKLYFISEAHLDVLVFELWFVIGNLFPQRAVVLLALDSDAACASLSGHSAIKSAVFGFSVMLQSHMW